MNKRLFLLPCLLLASVLSLTAQGAWSLQDCIEYARQNNIQVQKSRIAEEQGEVSLWQDRGALFPSLSFSTSQTVGYRPFEESTALVQNGQVTTTTNKTTYQGSYGLNANWTIWNGGINRKNIEAQKLQNEINQLATRESELSIQEQIAQLYVQIMYTKEAKRVNEQLLETAKSQLERGREMLQQGQMARADVAQLEAQASSAAYDVVSADAQIANYKRQLKALLELDLSTPFDVVGETPADEKVLAPIPNAEEAYEKALVSRPEIQSAELGVDAAELNVDIAKRGFLPTVGMSAGVGDSHYSASQKSTGRQMKTNLNASAGVTVSVPIFDNRRNRANVKQAKLQRATSQLSLQDEKNALSNTIEQYWITASTQQQNFIAAQARVKSQKESFDLLNEQFQNGLKNVVDVLQGRDNLLSAEQAMLQSKYMTLLNMQLLKFYTGEKINL